MLPIPNVIYTKCYLYKKLPIPMLPRQSVLDEMLLYENVLYETLLIRDRNPVCIKDKVFFRK